MKRLVLCVIGIAIALTLPLVALPPSFHSVHGAPVGQEDPGEGEYPQVIITDRIDASGNGTSVAQVTFKNADVYSLTFDLWWWAASASQQSNVHAWDAQGPISVQTETIGYRLYIYVLFRHSLPPGETYTYWLSTDIQNLAWWSGSSWSRGFCLCAGWPVGEYRVKLKLPSTTTVVAPNPSPITQLPSYVEWLFRDLSSSQCGCTSASYTTSACNRNPVLLVHGWHGSEQDDLAHDYQMGLFAQMLRDDGYVDGESLFYATGISEENKLEQNAAALQQMVRQAAVTSGCSTVDILAHSMGGLNTRAYIESGFYQDEADSGIQVRNVFMLGTPNGGVEGSLVQIAFGLWGAAQDGNLLNDMQSIKELSVPFMLEFNQSHTQPSSVRYHLIGGDVRSQLPILFALGASYPNDLLAARDSVHWLVHLPEHNAIARSTSDGHGCNEFFTSRGIPTYNCPDTTYDAYIAPYLSNAGMQPMDGGESILPTGGYPLASEYDPQDPMPHTPVLRGVIAAGQTVTQTVPLVSGGTTAFYLAWTEGDLDFSLADPVGTVISGTVSAGPNIDFVSVETDALFNYEAYVITDTLSGDWTLMVDAVDTHSQQVPFAAFAIPDSDLTFEVSVDQDWYARNEPAVITATLMTSTEPVTGATVEATIYRSDAISDTVTLHDDGSHNDGSVDDGVYGNSYPSTDVGGHYALLATASGNHEGLDYDRGAETGFSVSPGTAALTGTYSDYPEDANGNGMHEHLVVDVGIDVQQSGLFELSARLVDGASDPVAWASEYRWLTVGLQDVGLRFDGQAILTNGVDGPYTVTDVYLFDKSGVAVKLDEASNVWTTAAYDHEMFGDNWLLYLPIATKKYSP